MLPPSLDNLLTDKDQPRTLEKTKDKDPGHVSAPSRVVGEMFHCKEHLDMFAIHSMSHYLLNSYVPGSFWD